MANLSATPIDVFPRVNCPQRRPAGSARTTELRPGARLARAALTAAWIAVAALNVLAVQVRMREGTLVLVKLHDDITTENTTKGDRIELDVADNVVINNLVAVPKGAVAWGEVTRVRSSGKKSKLTGFVSFEVKGVHAVDNQQIGLRKTPEKLRRPKPGENEYEEASVIRGLRERMIGAEKGKEYAAYTDQEAVVNVPDTAPAAAPAPAPAPAAPQPAAPTSAAKELLEPEQGSIDFASDPAGADIAIDGSFVGNTPSTLRVAPGRHTIELRVPGHRPWSRTMLIGPGSHPSIRAFLEKESK